MVMNVPSGAASALDFRGPEKRLEDIDLPRIAHAIGCGEDEIHAVIDVETSGGSVDGEGRLKMLFEPHRFWKNLGPGEKRDRAAAQGLAYPRWGERPYPRDSYPALLRAIAIDESAALKSASWGLGQILGENHASAGYETVQAMVRDFTLDEDNHLEAMVRFIASSGLADALRAHDWAAFARGYNGPHYARHGYDEKLAERFAWWSRKADTPWSPSAVPEEAQPPSSGAIARPQPPASNEPSAQATQGDRPMTIPTLPVVILDVIAAAIREAAADPAVPIAPQDASKVAADVAAKAKQDPRLQEISERVAHATNGEPWYRSRVTWGAALTGVASLASVFGVALGPEDREAAIGFLTAAGGLAGAAVTLYGRWYARRPLAVGR